MLTQTDLKPLGRVETTVVEEGCQIVGSHTLWVD